MPRGRPARRQRLGSPRPRIRSLAGLRAAVELRKGQKTRPSVHPGLWLIDPIIYKKIVDLVFLAIKNACGRRYVARNGRDTSQPEARFLGRRSVWRHPALATHRTVRP